MGFFLLTVSWLLKTYGAVQEQRNPINTPAIWSSDAAKLLLIIVWIILLAIGSYFVYSNNGLIVLLLCLLIYFIVAPILFGKLIKKSLDRLGF